MKYKIYLEERFKEKKSKLKELGYIKINSWNSNIINNSYSIEEEDFIIKPKENGLSTKEIANILDRPYWGVVYKLRRMKNI